MDTKQRFPNSPLGVGGMIFAAGLGTRFKPWTNSHPKALALVKGKSLLQRNIEYLQQYGISNVVVNVHHFSEQIIREVNDNNGWGSNVIISDETNELLDTGGGLLKAKKHLQSTQSFITLNVDILTDLILNKVIEFHNQQQSLITLAIADRSTSRFLLFNSNNRLCGWRNIKEGKIIEKVVMPSEVLIQKAYSGIAIFRSEVLDLISFQGKFSLIDVYLTLTADHVISGYDHTGDKWIDVGRPESVPIAEKLVS
ncbi:MAG: NDP-sugar synthase [Chitinophagaceae bacterium]